MIIYSLNIEYKSSFIFHLLFICITLYFVFSTGGKSILMTGLWHRCVLAERDLHVTVTNLHISLRLCTYCKKRLFCWFVEEGIQIRWTIWEGRKELSIKTILYAVMRFPLIQRSGWGACDIWAEKTTRTWWRKTRQASWNVLAHAKQSLGDCHEPFQLHECFNQGLIVLPL